MTKILIALLWVNALLAFAAAILSGMELGWVSATIAWFLAAANQTREATHVVS